jgi:hypothetical protein
MAYWIYCLEVMLHTFLVSFSNFHSFIVDPKYVLDVDCSSFSLLELLMVAIIISWAWDMVRIKSTYVD